jgi:hypothetical protein
MGTGRVGATQPMVFSGDETTNIRIAMARQ